MTHFHVIIWCAMGKAGGNFEEVTYVDLICQTVDEAVERAKQMFPEKRHYWVNNVVEHHDHKHGGHEE